MLKNRCQSIHCNYFRLHCRLHIFCTDPNFFPRSTRKNLFQNNDAWM